MNRTLKLLLVSDVFVLTGFALIDPILAIFVKDYIVDGTIFAAGFSIALFLLVKAIVQLPLSKYIDSGNSMERHKRRVKFLHLGGLFVVLVPVVYIFATSVQHVFLAQILHGIGSGLMYPTWVGLWTTHLDKNREEFEWTIYSSSLGICTAFAGFSGSWVAQYYGFNITFIFVSALLLTGFLILLQLERKNRIKNKFKSKRIKNHDIVHYHVREKNSWMKH